MVFAFPVRGKRSVAWTAAIATTCSAVVPSQRSLPPGDRTYLFTVSTSLQRTAWISQDKPVMCFTFLVFFPTTRGKDWYGVPCALNQSQANITQKLSRSFQTSFIKENEIGPTQLTSTPPTVIISIFFASYSLVHFNRQVFLVKLANEHRYLRSSLLSLLYCHGACGRSSHLFELQFPLLWEEQIPSILSTWETGEEINKVTDKTLLSENKNGAFDIWGKCRQEPLVIAMVQGL